MKQPSSRLEGVLPWQECSEGQIRFLIAIGYY